MSDELKCCPFCGGEAKISKQHYGPDSGHVVYCVNCHTTGWTLPTPEEAAKWRNNRAVPRCNDIQRPKEPPTFEIVLSMLDEYTAPPEDGDYDRHTQEAMRAVYDIMMREIKGEEG